MNRFALLAIAAAFTASCRPVSAEQNSLRSVTGVRAKLLSEHDQKREIQLVFEPHAAIMATLSDFILTNGFKAADFDALGACPSPKLDRAQRWTRNRPGGSERKRPGTYSIGARLGGRGGRCGRRALDSCRTRRRTSHGVGISRVGGASGGASFVAMVQATDLGQLDHHPGLWRRHRARLRGVLDEGQMGSGAVVVGEVACENPAKMALAKDDYVVETLAADGSDQALDEGVLPRGPRGAHDLVDAHSFDATAKRYAKDGVAIPHEKPRRAGLGKCLHDLLSGPGGGRMLGQVEVQDATAIVSEDDENVEHAEGGGRDCEEIDRGQGADVVGQERAPGLRRRLAKVLWASCRRNGALADVDAELEQLSVDARRAPQRVRESDSPDDDSEIAIGGRPARRSTGPPGPEAPKSCAVPADDGGRFHK